MSDTGKGYTPDQPVVPKADVIYRPKGNAGEYAALATNPYVGCSHQCLYCYVPRAMHLDRKVFDAAAVPRQNFAARLLADCARYRKAGICDGHRADQIFMTFSSDPFHPGDIKPTIEAIEILQDNGLAFCTLSKGGTKAVPYWNLYRPGRDAYAASLTSLDDDFSLKWERKAARPADRIAALRAFHDRGIFTWVSLEPTLDTERSIAIVKATHTFVDLFKVGKANYIPTITNVVDWKTYTLKMLDVLTRLNASFYFKRDLQAHLPDGIHNPLRVPQHH
jgi:DNA repair photolyase